MRPASSENALSEVIGFILILVVIMTAFSIYLTYAVPAQGRENEILHMNEIRDQFVTYKVGVDALWTNRQVGTAMSTTFNLGTAGTATQGGGFSIIPIMNPIPSSGTLAPNQRQEVLAVQSRGLIRDGTVISKQTVALVSPGSTLALNATPQQFIVNISDTFNTGPLDYLSATKRGVLVQQGQNWSVNVTVNPKINYYYPNSTDITIDVMKNSILSLQGITVYQDIRSNVPYTVNLLDDSYGLKNYLVVQPYPMTVTFTKYGTLSSASSNVSFPDEYEKVATHSLALGALEYTASNNYWIPQTYYYQNGGVFLQQDDGTSIKLPPTITFSYNATDKMIGVKIIELPFQQTSSGGIGGNSPAQVRTQVTTIQDLPYSLTYNNTKWINISISSNDSKAVTSWLRSLNSTANISQGIPDSFYWTGLSAREAYIYFAGSDTTDLRYDIHVEGLRANLSATVQGGG